MHIKIFLHRSVYEQRAECFTVKETSLRIGTSEKSDVDGLESILSRGRGYARWHALLDLNDLYYRSDAASRARRREDRLESDVLKLMNERGTFAPRRVATSVLASIQDVFATVARSTKLGGH